MQFSDGLKSKMFANTFFLKYTSENNALQSQHMLKKMILINLIIYTKQNHIGKIRGL